MQMRDVTMRMKKRRDISTHMYDFTLLHIFFVNRTPGSHEYIHTRLRDLTLL